MKELPDFETAADYKTYIYKNRSHCCKKEIIQKIGGFICDGCRTFYEIPWKNWINKYER